jgi:hypothetical protein
MRIILVLSFTLLHTSSLLANHYLLEKSLHELGVKTGKKYQKYRKKLCENKSDFLKQTQFNSKLVKAMQMVINVHIEHPDICNAFEKQKRILDQNLKNDVSYNRGYSSYVNYLIDRRVKRKLNPAYRDYQVQTHNVKIEFKKEKIDDEVIKIPTSITGDPIALTDDEKKKLDYMKKNPKYIPLTEAEKLQEKQQISSARIRLLEYALKETDKPHELYGILLNNPYIEPKKEDINYKSAKTLYDYVILRYIYNLDIILSEMEKRDERLRKVYEGKPRYMYTVEKALNLLDKNKLYGTISLLEALRKHFEVNPKKNKIIINAINKKIEEFRKKNAKEIQWTGVFERVNPM